MSRKLVRFADLPPVRRSLRCPVQTSLHRKLTDRLRQRLFRAFKGRSRNASAVRDLGCSIPKLKAHLESLFTPGMSWDNYGRGRDKWCIDHVVPLSSANLADLKSVRQVCHYSNLQPLWWGDNIRKGGEVGPSVIVDLMEFCHA